MREGILVDSVNPGRIALDDAEEGPELARGQPLDIWLLNEWWSGRVKYADRYGGYYFLGDDGMISLLVAGMSVRLP